MLETLLPSASLVLNLTGMTCIAGASLMWYLKDEKGKTKIIRDFFENSKLYIKNNKDNKTLPELLDHRQEGEDQELFIYTIPNGLSIKDFKKKKEALEHQLNGELELWAKGKVIFIRLYSASLPNRAEFEDYRKFILKQVRQAKLGLSIGFSRRGYIVNDFSTATCHLILGGETGAGKSVLLRQAILSGMLAYSHHELNYYFVDLKGGIEMNHFRDAAHTQNIAESEHETLEILSKLCQLVDERMKMLKGAGVTSFYDLKNTTEPKIILVVDELAELQANDDCLELLERLLRLARATGIHVVAATQRPDRKVLPGQLKANLPVSVAMKTKNDINSQILLDDPEAAYLEPIPGRGIYQLNDNIKIQVPYINVETTQKLINERNKALGYSSTEEPERELELVDEDNGQEWEVIV